MSATPANDAQTPSAWNCGAKVVNYFGLGKREYEKNATYANFA